MKKLFSILAALIILLTAFAGHAENTSIGAGLTLPVPETPSAGALVSVNLGGLLTPSDSSGASSAATGVIGGGLNPPDSSGLSSAATGGIGGGLTQPTGGFTVQPRSADNGKGTRPSPEWLGTVDAPIITDLIKMVQDPGFIGLTNLSDSTYSLLNIADEYNAQPSIVIYGNDELPFTLSALLAGSGVLVTREYGYNIYSAILSGFQYTSMNIDETVLYNSCKLTAYFPTDIDYAFTAAIYTAADSSDGDPIMVIHKCHGGITTATAQFIIADTLTSLTDNEDDAWQHMSLIGLNLYTSDDIFPEFSASTQTPADIAAADDEWLTATAFELAGEIVAIAGNPEMASMYSSDPDVLGRCAEFAEFDISAASVSSIEHIPTDKFPDFLAPDANSMDPYLLQKYYMPKFGSIYATNRQARDSTVTIAAASIGRTEATYFAAGDFVSCNVTLTCGGKYDIIISYGYMGDGIMTATACFVPAE